MRRDVYNKNLTSPYLTLLKKSGEITFISDSRIDEKKLLFLNNALSKSEKTGIQKTRVYSTTSQNNKTGGVTIYLPSCFDNIIKVLYQSKDNSEIPRYLSLVCKLTGGPNIILSAVYGSPQNAKEKLKVWKRYHEHMQVLTSKFGSCPLIVAGDWNQKLDLISESVITPNEVCLKTIIQDFDLCDFYQISTHEFSKNDKIRLERQGQIPCINTLGNTFYPKITGNRPSRIDGVLLSNSLLSNMIQKNLFLSNEHPSADHKSVHITFTWSLCGISNEKNKIKFFFHNHLIDDKIFMKRLRRSIADTLIAKYWELDGSIPENVIREIKLQNLENILFDRIKNQNMNFSAVDLIYQIFNSIEKLQNSYLKSRHKKENSQEIQIIENLKILENIKNPSKSEQRKRIATSKMLSDIQRRKLKRQALDASLDYQLLGESGTRYYLRSKTQKRNASFVREFEDSSGKVITDSDEIEKCFYNHFKQILSTPDPFCPQLFYNFIAPCRAKFKQILESDKKCFEREISAGELAIAISKIRSESCPGPDGISGKLLRILHSVCPRLLLKAINCEVLKGECEGKLIMRRNLIFIPKNIEQITIKRHRPISLLNSCLKLADTCIVQRLVLGLQNANILPPSMSAYRKGHSICDANLSLQTFIENCKHTGRRMVILNFDITAAFDKCSQNLVLESMRLLNFNEELISAFSKLPNAAMAKICINLAENKFPDVSVDGGSPQGMASSGYKYSLAMLILICRINMPNMDLYQIDLCAKRKASLISMYINQRWAEQGKTGQIDTAFKNRIKLEWSEFEESARDILSAEINQQCIYKDTIKTLSGIESTINYSDDGQIMIDYKSVQSILNIMNIFEDFGKFSGLQANPQKTKIITINFEMSNEDKSILIERGFDPRMISGGFQKFRFLGCDFIPDDLKKGATGRLNQICDEMKKIASAFSDGTTLRGRKTICQSLLLSKLQSIIITFDFTEKELSNVQRIINNFCHKKKIVSGASKFLSFAKAGIQIPKYYIRYLVSRAALLKGLHTKIVEGRTLPIWGQILYECLKYIGFNKPELVFRSLGIGDLKFIVQKLCEMGFKSLAGIFRSVLILNQIHEKRREYGKSDEKKRREEKQLNCNKGTCLQYNRDCDNEIINKRKVGSKDKHGRFRDSPDPPGFRSISIIGSDYDDDLIKRNKKSLFTILKELKDGNGLCPAFESSARNCKEMSIWILNCAAAPVNLLNEENAASPDSRIIPIIERSTRSKHIFNDMVGKAQKICINRSNVIGAGSPIFIKNPFISWMGTCTSNSNARSIYYQTLSAMYSHIKSTTIRKLEKSEVNGRITNERIGKALQRAVGAYNTYKMERTSIEISLCTVRWAKDIARIQNTPARPCYVCGVYESLYGDHEYIVRNTYKHVFMQCAPAVFLSQYLRAMSYRILGCHITITFELIMLNELPPKIAKHTSKCKLKVFFTILNAFKSALYSLYYGRPWNVSGEMILRSFSQNIKSAKLICIQRGSNLMDRINIPNISFFSFISYQNIHKTIMYETKSLRCDDSTFRRKHHLTRRLNTNTTNNSSDSTVNTTRQRKQTKTFSVQKRQILIFEVMKRIPQKTYTKSGQLELARTQKQR